MAAAKEVNTDIITCPICLQGFRSPKSLPCLHSFCEQCISEYIQREDNKQEEKITTYPCPVCRTPVTPTNLEADVSQWGPLLPENCMLSSRLTSGNEQQRECNPCKRGKKSEQGELWCRDCKEFMCIGCNEVHSLLKCSANHKVCGIENIVAKKYGIDITAISETCAIHSSNQMEAFCFDHKQLCCVSCLTHSHRKCNDVQTIAEIAETQNDDPFRMDKVLPLIQTMIEDLVTQKQRKLDRLNDSIESSKGKASRAVASAKDNLDCLLISFSKELGILEDNEKSAVETELSQLDELKTNASHLCSVAQFVSDEGTHVQQFIHFEHVKSQIKNNIMPIINDLNNEENTVLELKLNSTLDEICSLSDVGKLSVVRSRDDGKEFGSVIQTSANIYNFLGLKVMTAKYKKAIQLPGQMLTCGASLTEQIIACGYGNDGHLVGVNIMSECVKYKFNWTYIKRVVFDRKRNLVHVSYVNRHFRIYKFENGFKASIDRFQTDSHLGGLAIYENDVYVIADNSIKKVNIDAILNDDRRMTQCFKTNTVCPDYQLNGLAIDPKTKHIIYTSKDNEVICTTFEGGEVFRIKDWKEMTKPTSLFVHSSSDILVGDESGSVHVISPDGKHHSILIEKCQKITKLCDIWLDHLEQTLFLCGDEFIEMYNISCV